MAVTRTESEERRGHAMRTITIAEDHSTPSGFVAQLTFEDSPAISTTINLPFGDEQERQLDWHFEGWPQSPFKDASVARRAGASIRTYGNSLFIQVFADTQALSHYATVRNELKSVQVVIISKSPAFQALHWEALWDPESPHPMAVECSLVRRCASHAAVQTIPPQPSAVLNLLLVCVRPRDDDQEGYQTLSRPMVDVVTSAQLRVNVDLVRPATFAALSKQLHSRGPGYYHIVHIDAQVSARTYEEVRGKEPVLVTPPGRSDLRRYKATKTYLELEGDNGKAPADYVEAADLAKLLASHGVAICVLNAHKARKKYEDNDAVTENGHACSKDCKTGIEFQLAAGGPQMVVAMSHAATISAQVIFMDTFCVQLLARRPVLEALRRARMKLLTNQERKACHNTTVELQDWVLPVVYACQPLDLRLRDFEGQEEEEAYAAELNGRFQYMHPTYGFVGREPEIHKIEDALMRHNVILLCGIGGTGKTTLLTYLREWWEVTRFARKVFYFGYNEQAWTLRQLLFEIVKQTLNPSLHGMFQTMSLRMQEAKVVARLQTEDYVLVLDNLESVVGQQTGAKSALAPIEQTEIRRFLKCLTQSRTKVVLCSRSKEDWLADMFRESCLNLCGLDTTSAQVLADRILERHMRSRAKIAELQQSEHFHRLMHVLSGYPLALQVVLPSLVRLTPQDVLSNLDAADVELGVSCSSKTQDIMSCVEFTYHALSQSEQRLLVCLAPFRAFVASNALFLYSAELQKLGPFRNFDFGGLDGVVQDAVSWGLLSPVTSDDDKGQVVGIAMQPVLPCFLTAKLNQVDRGLRRALREGFKNLYKELAAVYCGMMRSKLVKESLDGLKLCRLEHDNLCSALQLCLEDKDSISISNCLHWYYRLKRDFQGALQFSQFLCKSLEAYSPGSRTGVMGPEVFSALNWLAKSHIDVQHYEQAREAHNKALELHQSIEPPFRDKLPSLGYNYHELGMVASRLREFEAARQNYERALDIRIESGDQPLQAATYHELGIVAKELGEFLVAREKYQKALDIMIEFGNRSSQAVTYYELGGVAAEVGEFDEARKQYAMALDIYAEFDDQCGLANVYHGLGLVAKELREFDDAHLNFQRALDIKVGAGLRHSQAATYRQLGAVAGLLNDLDKARSHYQRALEIDIEYEDHQSQASTYHELGLVAHRLGDFVEVRTSFQRALEIEIAFGDRHSQASTHHNLGMAAKELQEFDDARLNYQRALEIYVEFDDRFSQANTHHCLGVVAHELGDFDGARGSYEEALDIFKEFGDHHFQASIHYDLGVLAEAQGRHGEAEARLREALRLFRDQEDERWADLSLRGLERVRAKVEGGEEGRKRTRCTIQ